MSGKFKIVMVGGGSVAWSPKILNDMMLKEGLGEAEYVLLDIDRRAAERMASLARLMAARRGLGCSFIPMTNQRKAFEGADAIIITISTGGLDAMVSDIAVPERYGIYQTVGDTVGPGGWARGLRNIPVFARMAGDIRAAAPDAWVLNYTNPMGMLTKTLCLLLDQPVVGLCHGVFEVFDVLKKVFKLEREDDIKVRFGGVNHFFWILDMRIRDRDGYAMLRRRMKGRDLSRLIGEVYGGKSGAPRHRLASELLKQTGYLPYFGDRHTAEFVSGYVNVDEARLADFGLERTSVQWRRDRMRKKTKQIEDMIAGRRPLPPDVASRETAADISATKAVGGEFVDVVNLPNRGQIANLPYGSVVETMGVVNPLGFTPLAIGELPPPLPSLVRPHAENQDVIVQAVLEGDKEKGMQALLNDPVCSHLPKCRIRKMGEELLAANKKLLPRPFGSAPPLRW